MARFKNHLLVAVGFAIAGMIGAAFGTGTAQAVVATLVEVVNPTSSPVPTSVTNPGTSPVLNSSVDDPGRIAYQSTVTNTACSASSTCSINFPTVPTGHRVVVQRIFGWTLGSSSSTSFVPGTSPVIISSLVATGTIFRFFASPVTGFIGFNESVQEYVDGGFSASLNLATTGPDFFFGDIVVTLTGYELDCTVAACAAIAKQ